MGNFDIAYNITLGHEGGYCNDPDDAGGETYKGIARNKQHQWVGWMIVDKLKTQANFPKILDDDFSLQQDVKSFYKKNFWDVYSADSIPNQDICNEIFDTGVNQGTGTAAKYLQEALNLLNRNEADYKDLLVDGNIGSITLSVLNNHKNLKGVLKTLNGLQFMRYYNICIKDPSQEKYFNGWLQRC